ncbi:SDR family oxidoreductase [Nocardioides sp. SYSU D00038]|uniref:SDR family oxidoreductase n=1 Tax=Nocardioides sp. SYSU D00038 TaxID=2812554 RepID=UPI00196735D7|nr:NAD(P)H-binding protein [Nocardioides sp. SYSU D00038]
MRIAVAGATGLIGTRLAALARTEGHEVVEIARETGFDLLQADDPRLAEALIGVEAVVDVTQGPAIGPEATAFFTTVAENLGRAATAAGVARSVVLSIVGTDLSPDYDYYVAKTEQEKAVRAHAPGAVVLRATQFHDFPGQMLQWNRDGDVARIIDVPIQPVDTAEIVRLLLDLATGAASGDTDLAGPRQERLIDLVQRWAAHLGDDVTVEPVEAPASMAGGSMLPGPAALLRGPSWQEWLAARAAG